MNNTVENQMDLFAREWLIDFDGQAAAIRAGYSAKTAAAQASRLLTQPRVINLITKLQEVTNDKLQLTRERVIEEMARVGLVDVRKLFNNGRLRDIESLDDDTAAAVSSVEVVTSTLGHGEDVEIEHTHKIKMHPKMQALDKLGQHFNIYEDHQKSGSGEVHIHLDDKDSQA